MEIRKHGEQRNDQHCEFVLRCPYCGCEFSFSSEEIEKQEKRINGFAYIHCPDCKHEIEFSPKESLVRKK